MFPRRSNRIGVSVIGGTVCTSIEAMRRFFNRLQEQQAPFQPSGYVTDGLPLSASLRSPYRNRLTPARRRQQEEISQKLDFELFGCDRLIDECGYSTETLREIFDRLCEKLPTTHITGDRTYETVRRAIFTRAVEIMQGLHGTPKGLKGAKAWIESLDPKTMDVTQLKGCGAHTADEWKKLVEQGKIPSASEDRALP